MQCEDAMRAIAHGIISASFTWADQDNDDHVTQAHADLSGDGNILRIDFREHNEDQIKDKTPWLDDARHVTSGRQERSFLLE
jgi:hypothetical protein